MPRYPVAGPRSVRAPKRHPGTLLSTTIPSHCFSPHALAGVGLLSLLWLAGCTSNQEKSPGHDNLMNLARNYGMYQGQHRGRTPPDEKTFKAFIRKREPNSNCDTWFVSPRDQQPYVIRYGQKLGVPSVAKGAPIVVHEKVGVGGRRLVARSTVQIEELDEAKLQEAVASR